jgi:ABC-2 type transport system permease protein
MSLPKSLTDVLAVMTNEFRVLRRSRTAIIISLVILPVFFTLSLGGATGGAGETFSPTASLPIAFVDNDLTVSSGQLYGALSSSGDFNNLIQGYREESAVATLGTGKIYAAIIVPKGFQEGLANNDGANIVVYVDDSVNGLDSQIISSLNKSLQYLSPAGQAKPSLGGSASQIEIVRKGAAFSGFAVGLTIILGLVIIFATFYEIAGGMSRESEEGTYARLLLSPTSLGAVMMGKTLYDLVLNVIRTLIVFGLGVYAYGARPNTDFGTILALSLLMALLTMGFGFLISALGVGVRAVIIIEFFLVLFLFSFSGFIIDRELLVGISKLVSYSLPWAYGIEMLRATILVGQPLLSMTSQLQFVVGSIVVFYGLAYLFLRLSRERLIA